MLDYFFILVLTFILAKSDYGSRIDRYLNDKRSDDSNLYKLFEIETKMKEFERNLKKLSAENSRVTKKTLQKYQNQIEKQLKQAKQHLRKKFNSKSNNLKFMFEFYFEEIIDISKRNFKNTLNTIDDLVTKENALINRHISLQSSNDLTLLTQLKTTLTKILDLTNSQIRIKVLNDKKILKSNLIELKDKLIEKFKEMENFDNVLGIEFLILNIQLAKIDDEEIKELDHFLEKRNIFVQNELNSVLNSIRFVQSKIAEDILARCSESMQKYSEKCELWKKAYPDFISSTESENNQLPKYNKSMRKLEKNKPSLQKIFQKNPSKNQLEQNFTTSSIFNFTKPDENVRLTTSSSLNDQIIRGPTIMEPKSGMIFTQIGMKTSTSSTSIQPKVASPSTDSFITEPFSLNTVTFGTNTKPIFQEKQSTVSKISEFETSERFFPNESNFISSSSTNSFLNGSKISGEPVKFDSIELIEKNFGSMSTLSIPTTTNIIKDLMIMNSTIASNIESIKTSSSESLGDMLSEPATFSTSSTISSLDSNDSSNWEYSTNQNDYISDENLDFENSPDLLADFDDSTNRLETTTQSILPTVLTENSLRQISIEASKKSNLKQVNLDKVAKEEDSTKLINKLNLKLIKKFDEFLNEEDLRKKSHSPIENFKQESLNYKEFNSNKNEPTIRKLKLSVTDALNEQKSNFVLNQDYICIKLSPQALKEIRDL